MYVRYGFYEALWGSMIVNSPYHHLRPVNPISGPAHLYKALMILNNIEYPYEMSHVCYVQDLMGFHERDHPRPLYTQNKAPITSVRPS